MKESRFTTSVKRSSLFILPLPSMSKAFGAWRLSPWLLLPTSVSQFPRAAECPCFLDTVEYSDWCSYKGSGLIRWELGICEIGPKPAHSLPAPASASLLRGDLLAALPSGPSLASFCVWPALILGLLSACPHLSSHLRTSCHIVLSPGL